MPNANGRNFGHITQVIGSTLDAEFDEDKLPSLYNALKVDVERKVLGMSEHEALWCEVALHLGGGKIRAVALGSTDGLVRGSKIEDTGGPVTVPVGTQTLGRVFNLVGEPIDMRGPVTAESRRPIHHEPPEFASLTPKSEMMETGIKVIDLLAPFVRERHAGRIIMPTGGVNFETGPKYREAIAANGFTPILGMSAPLELVEKENKPGDPETIRKSLAEFAKKMAAAGK